MDNYLLCLTFLQVKSQAGRCGDDDLGRTIFRPMQFAGTLNGFANQGLARRHPVGVKMFRGLWTAEDFLNHKWLPPAGKEKLHLVTI